MRFLICECGVVNLDQVQRFAVAPGRGKVSDTDDRQVQHLQAFIQGKGCAVWTGTQVGCEMALDIIINDTLLNRFPIDLRAKPSLTATEE